MWVGLFCSMTGRGVDLFFETPHGLPGGAFFMPGGPSLLEVAMSVLFYALSETRSQI